MSADERKRMLAAIFDSITANAEGVDRLEPCEDWRPCIVAAIPEPVMVAPDDGGCHRSGRRDSRSVMLKQSDSLVTSAGGSGWRARTEQSERSDRRLISGGAGPRTQSCVCPQEFAGYSCADGRFQLLS